MREGEGIDLEEGIQNQCNSLHRSKTVSASNQYKPIQSEVITSQLSLSKYARLEQNPTLERNGVWG